MRRVSKSSPISHGKQNNLQAIKNDLPAVFAELKDTAWQGEEEEVEAVGCARVGRSTHQPAGDEEID